MSRTTYPEVNVSLQMDGRDCNVILSSRGAAVVMSPHDAANLSYAMARLVEQALAKEREPEGVA